MIDHETLKKSLDSQKKKRKSKYGNKKLKVDGVVFDSIGEHRRHCSLVIQEKAGIIKDLKRQVSFSIDINGVHICRYIADWTYILVSDGQTIVEDFKGVQTGVFKLKNKLMKACHGIDIWINKNIRADCQSRASK